MNYCATYLGDEGFGTYEVTWSDPPVFRRVNKAPDVILVPGFVDVHIHGGWGLDFMTASTNQITELSLRLLKEGYESWLPTTVTASADAVMAAINRLPDHPMIAGFHLEGPFISPDFPGAQPAEFIVTPDPVESEWDEILDHPKLRYVTLAPELPHALELTSRLMKRGVIVSMGHSSATYEEARRGFEFGASHTTHTFNAMRPFHHREAGLVGYALMNDAVQTELIYDRLHVSHDAAALLFKFKGPDGIIAVSDSSAATRLDPGQTIEMWGHKAFVGNGDVRLENGTLAGSAITLLDAFRNIASDFGEEAAIRTCSVNPRAALRMKEFPHVFVELDRRYGLRGIRVHGQKIDL